MMVNKMYWPLLFLFLSNDRIVHSIRGFVCSFWFTSWSEGTEKNRNYSMKNKIMSIICLHFISCEYISVSLFMHSLFSVIVFYTSLNTTRMHLQLHVSWLRPRLYHIYYNIDIRTPDDPFLCIIMMAHWTHQVGVEHSSPYVTTYLAILSFTIGYSTSGKLVYLDLLGLA